MRIKTADCHSLSTQTRHKSKMHFVLLCCDNAAYAQCLATGKFNINLRSCGEVE